MDMEIVDIVLREYNKKDFNEEVWRLKWDDFYHPFTKERGADYLQRNIDKLPFNPALQKDAKVIIVLEPLYGPKR